MSSISARIPVSTYRLQFNKLFRFSDCREIVSYLHDLGISDIYASPYIKAREGSLHGYDIVDHNTLNPEVGTEEEYNEMAGELQKYGMGQILDIVPNHMCIASKDNAWWMDVLENGPSSIYADFFDIDWEPVKRELKDKILIPILGDQYGNILDGQELRLFFENGAFYAGYYEHRFPLIPKAYIDILQHRIETLEELLSGNHPHFVELLSIITALNYLPPYTEREREKVAERYREKEIIKKRLLDLYEASPEIRAFLDENVRIFNGMKERPESFDLLDNLLNRQVYRLSNWRVATEEINYRRFFDINELAAIRMENPAVFQEAHRLIFRLIKEDKVTGLRIDHPDGLYNPLEYFQWLQRASYVQKRLSAEGSIEKGPVLLKEFDDILSSEPHYKPFYIIGEKILTRGERMPEDWPLFSTTGYVFLNIVNGIFVDTTNVRAMDEIYSRFIRRKVDFYEIVYEKKKLIMQVAMSSEINMLAHYLNRISEKNRHTRDFTLNSLRGVIVEVIAFFPVYRTYITRSGVDDRDRRYIEIAVSRAKRRNPAISESIFDFLKDVLMLNYPAQLSAEDRREWLDFTMRFQQITGPVMAKGVEDTVFYVYNRLVSLNEVGGNPDRFGTPLEAFHGQNIERLKFWPHALITTAIHDNKRGEDVRARINVLSEMPRDWREKLALWRRFNKKKKVIVEGEAAPAPNEEYLLYQTLIGAWPVEIRDESDYGCFMKRIKDYMLKALREAKVNTSWISPNRNYEEAVMTFIDSVMEKREGNLFLREFEPFQRWISHCGMFNSLSQALLKIASPGIPDFYQGTELWDFSLVDPDNRNPVDYGIRAGLLGELKRRGTEMSRTELARELTIHKEDGRIKLYLTSRVLNYRRENREFFERGEYIPLEVRGGKANQVIAFSRALGEKKAIVVAPRFFTKLITEPGSLPLGKEVWDDTRIILPTSEAGERYYNIFTGGATALLKEEEISVLYLSDLLADFPVALAVREIYPL